MGHRANLILLENKLTKIYFSHWDGQKTSKILAQGLEFCEKHFKKHNQDGWLMDNAWSEGGILIDKDNKVILFFDLEYFNTIVIRNFFIEFLQKTKWIGWYIEWAYKGNVDFAEYLGLMEERILALGTKPNFNKLESLNNLIYEDDEDWASRTFVTLIGNDSIKDYLILGYGEEINFCLAEGRNLKENLPIILEVSNLENVKEAEIEDVLLVDYNKKQLYVCWANDTDNRYIEAVKEIWIGWHIERQTKGIEFNFEYTLREKSYIVYTEQEFREYINECKVLEYK